MVDCRLVWPPGVLHRQQMPQQQVKPLTEPAEPVALATHRWLIGGWRPPNCQVTKQAKAGSLNLEWINDPASHSEICGGPPKGFFLVTPIFWRGDLIQ